jgi:soluble lytic murein transglycosylase-like protein
LLVAYKPVPTAIAQPARAESNSQSSSASDPEAVRIRDELKRLRDDAEARRAFYDDLRRTVERVRSGELHEGSRKSGPTGIEPRRPSAQPAQAQDPDGKTFSVRPATHPEDIQPAEPDEPEAPQAQWSPSSGSIDRTAYQRVVRWAKANGTPVQLALAVAWMESHLNENAPRGGSGEVGMFQIMPARCVTEGWPAGRLSEPEFNAWMGTMLLTRYYQEEGSVARAAAKYVAGPGVFNKTYSKDVWDYINWYASTVESYANYFSRFQT